MPPETSDPRQTPAMQQYYRFKRQHPDCILLFRIGDFYEMFDDDAVTVSKAIGLTLTARQGGVPLAGVPYHQLETYLRRLVAQGFRVAVCEQVEDAAQAKGLVQRDVTRVITPGTLVDESLLDDSASVHLAALCFPDAGDDSRVGIATVEVSTGAFIVTETSAAGVIDELASRGVRELLFAEVGDGKAPPRVDRILRALGASATPRPAWQFRTDEARRVLCEHFRVNTLGGFGLRDDDAALPAAGAALLYLKETQARDAEAARDGSSAAQRAECVGTTSRPRATLDHLRPPRRQSSTDTCIIDAVSLRSLEVERTIRADSPQSASVGGRVAVDPSLVGLFMRAGVGQGTPRTPMGKRLLRDWLCRPLRETAQIQARHAAVAMLVDARRTADEVGEQLANVQDVARISGRIALGRVTPRDLVALGRSCAAVGDLLVVLHRASGLESHVARLQSIRDALVTLSKRLLETCVDEPPPHLREGGLIKDGVDAALDEARLLQRDAGTWLAAYQERLASEMNLPGIKVGYNKIFGYYIELTAAQAKNAPPTLARKQTLKNAERYTTPELHEFERKVSTAEGRALERERAIFDQMCGLCASKLSDIAEYAAVVAELDVLLAFSDRAHRRGWTRPEMTDTRSLSIHAGRHPVLEELLGADFVPNDCELGQPGQNTSDPARVALITGPNMAGKSTFIRQVALITLLAHAGSFVPADRAAIGVCDRIFTRIGADDALHAGQSTFMVEMTETANILNHATPRSLVILDEIGRGTSTLDGLSLAWAIAEFLAREESAGDSPRTLFATHYHELTDLEERLPGRVKNLHVAVREWPGPDGHSEIIFLHRILPGRADQSYGIHVARLAGLPADVVSRAREVMSSLAVEHDGRSVAGGNGSAGLSTSAGRADTKAVPRQHDSGGQFSLFTQYLEHPAVIELKKIKIDSLSPLQAFDALRKLKEAAATNGQA